MGQFVPLIGTLRGKIGAMVVDKTGRTRLHSPGPNRTPIGVKNAFKVLARSWPYSSVAFKSMVSDAPGIARGIGFLTGRAYRAYQWAPKVAKELAVDDKGIVPYRLSNLPGEFGEGQQLAPFVPTVTIASGGISLIATFGEIPTVQEDSWEMAVLILNSTMLLEGTIDSNLPGAALYDGTPVSDVVTAIDNRLTTTSTAGMYVIFVAIIAADATTGLPVCHGFFSGAVEVE